MTADDLKAAIHRRYEWPEWHVESEVTLGGRRLDVVALNMWGARRWRIVGFEIKVSRGDWIRELDSFQKSEQWTEVVDSFYVVTPPKLIKADELPVGWGHLELAGSRMMTRAHAQVREGDRRTFPREVAARFITRMGQSVEATKRDFKWKLEHELREEIRADVEKRTKTEYEARINDCQTRIKDYNDLLGALGLNPATWHAQENALRAAAAFAAAQGNVGTLRASLDRTIREFDGHVARMRDASTLIEQADG